jgi:hypothetical protein
VLEFDIRGLLDHVPYCPLIIEIAVAADR